MKNTQLFITILFTSTCWEAHAQITPAPLAENWTVYNRQVEFRNEEIYLNAQEKDGILWLNDATFSNGTIELDIKGKDVRGQSFVGIAFHGKDNQTYDGVYFRPFNFRSEERKNHSVQYISMPGYDWSTLRDQFPGKYENTVQPVPDPNEWFHARIVIDSPSVRVYVDGSEVASLEVEQISDRREGMIGLWVGNGSDGWFKNVRITSK